MPTRNKLICSAAAEKVSVIGCTRHPANVTLKAVEGVRRLKRCKVFSGVTHNVWFCCP